MAEVGLGTEYLEIALRLRRLEPDWIEGYVGPADLADAVDRSEPIGAAELRECSEQLAERAEEEEEAVDRRAWLVAQLRAISTALQWRGTKELDYAALFASCHGARVEHVPDGQFEGAHALLDRSLPGSGDVRERYRTWRKGQLVPRERLAEAIDLLAADMRGRCRATYGLPEDERVTWELVSGKPWAGNAEYLGKRHTLISINAERPISAHRLLELVCHEAYPGHHSENVCKDASLIEGAARVELSVYVYPTPQALIAEGVGCLALHALLGEQADSAAAECLQKTGIVYDHTTATAARQAEELLLPVRSNIAMMLDGGRSLAEARDYARTWLLDEPSEIDDAVAHLEARSWRPYEACYPVGLALCRQYAAGRAERFMDLLHQQLTPADLVGETS